MRRAIVRALATGRTNTLHIDSSDHRPRQHVSINGRPVEGKIEVRIGGDVYDASEVRYSQYTDGRA